MIAKVFRKNWFLLLTVLITAAAFGCRLVYCHWGYPLRLQPDEHAIVDKAMEMLSRHSWEADQYNRPDHFEIKCNSIIFTALSWVKFHKPAYEAFPEYTTYFYLRARYFTAVFGTALVPLVGALAGLLAASFRDRYKKIIQFFAMFFTAFPELFIENSSYATPDIVLTFFVTLFAWFSVLYLKNGNRKYLYYCMVIIGIGITIKYPAALLALPFAYIFIYREFICKDHNKNSFWIIPKYVCISIGVIFLTVFIIAPNLITNFDAVLKTLRMEARDYHIGADGLGFWGNLKFYFHFIAADIGTVCLIPFFIGLFRVLWKRQREYLILTIGLVYWICMSVLSLHWVRWGIPMFVFFILITALGFGTAFQFADSLSSHKQAVSFIAKAGLILFSTLLVVNVGLAALAKVKYSTIPDTRWITMSEMPEHGITAENSAYEPYTPFAPNGSGANAAIGSFHFTDSGLKIGIEHALKKYYVSTDSYRDRYFADPEKYPNQVERFNALDAEYDVVYTITADGNFRVDGDTIKNIRKSVAYLTGKQTGIGVNMTVYDLAPDPVYILITSPEGTYLTVDDAQLDLNGVYYPTLSEEPFLWVRYGLDDGQKDAVLSSRSGWALDVRDADFTENTLVRLFPASGNSTQQWEILDEGESAYLLCGEGMALTRRGNQIVIEPFDSLPEQQWNVRRHYINS